MIEVWKDIEDYEGLYQVSNFGNIKSLSREVYDASGKFHYTINEKIRKKYLDNNTGYYVIVLSKGGKRKTHKVHKLVAMSFLKHEPDGHNLVIDHINEDKTDNYVDNLRIVTQRFNNSRRKLCYSEFTGVSWYKVKKKWRAMIQINGNYINLGNFDNEYEAHLSYQKKLKEIL